MWLLWPPRTVEFWPPWSVAEATARDCCRNENNLTVHVFEILVKINYLLDDLDCAEFDLLY